MFRLLFPLLVLFPLIAGARAETQALVRVATDEPALYPSAEVSAWVDAKDRSLVALVTSERPDEPALISDLAKRPGRTTVLKHVWGVPAVRASVLPGFTARDGGSVKVSFRWNTLGTHWRSVELQLAKASDGSWKLNRGGSAVRTITLWFHDRPTPQALEVE